MTCFNSCVDKYSSNFDDASDNSEVRNVACKFHLNNKCNRGFSCRFVHSCILFLNSGSCQNPNYNLPHLRPCQKFNSGMYFSLNCSFLNIRKSSSHQSPRFSAPSFPQKYRKNTTFFFTNAEFAKPNYSSSLQRISTSITSQCFIPRKEIPVFRPNLLLCTAYVYKSNPPFQKDLFPLDVSPSHPPPPNLSPGTQHSPIYLPSLITQELPRCELFGSKYKLSYCSTFPTPQNCPTLTKNNNPDSTTHNNPPSK
jgi:hypothetical protein